MIVFKKKNFFSVIGRSDFTILNVLFLIYPSYNCSTSIKSSLFLNSTKANPFDLLLSSSFTMRILSISYLLKNSFISFSFALNDKLFNKITYPISSFDYD